VRRLTELVLRHRRLVLVTWLVLFVLGGFGVSKVGSLLSNRFSVPGADSERGLNILRDRFHERSDGAFTLVAQPSGGTLDAAAVEAAAQRGATAVTGGKAGPVLHAGGGVAYVQIQTVLENAKASDRTPQIRATIGQIPGAHLYLTGFPTIVRALLVPATMKLLGHWNWYLPDGVRRALRLRPAPVPSRS